LGDETQNGSDPGPAFDLREPSPTFGRPIQHRDSDVQPPLFLSFALFAILVVVEI